MCEPGLSGDSALCGVPPDLRVGGREPMSEPFSAKLGLVLKVFSMSRGRLAADLGIDKSVVGRWVTGAVKPSAHNLSLITALVARRLPGFTSLDWERSLPALATLLGADPTATPGLTPAPGLQFALLNQALATTTLRGGAYEGFFRSTRPFLTLPGRFLHDHMMIRLDPPTALLRFHMGVAGTFFEGWVLPIQNQLFCIAEDITSGAPFFAILNGVGTSRADLLDGLSLGSALDTGRTPTAMALILERVGDLSGDREADDAHFAELAARDPVAPQGSVPDDVRDHLLRDIGPSHLAAGGDLLLRMPLSRSISRGPLLPGELGASG